MKSSTLTSLMLVVLATVLSVSPAGAQDARATPAANDPKPRPVEVTPSVSMDSRGGTPIAAAVTFPLGARFSLESETGYRRAEGDLKAVNSSISLLYDLPRVGRAAPYVAGGVGLAQYGTPLFWRDGTLIGTQPKMAFEVNAGGGIKVPVNDTWGTRTDARWFKSFGKDGSEHFRVSQGVSFGVRKK